MRDKLARVRNGLQGSNKTRQSGSCSIPPRSLSFNPDAAVPWDIDDGSPIHPTNQHDGARPIRAVIFA
jgi:hypothetical protein